MKEQQKSIILEISLSDCDATRHNVESSPSCTVAPGVDWTEVEEVSSGEGHMPDEVTWHERSKKAKLRDVKDIDNI